MRSLLLLIVCAAVAGCATNVERAVSPGMPSSEVAERIGKPIAEGRLAGNDTYWDYSRDPYGYFRVTFGPDERVREVRDLHTEQNFRRIQPGMTSAQVVEIAGVPPPYLKEGYGNGTRSWTYRYDDASISKLLHVIFDPSDRVLWYYSEWDPNIYSKKSGGH
jgi:outer membrane protein assembly factor BamE (lipoprotein component of BamABCDE complex)